MPDIATADLLFASDQANHNFSHILGDLRRSRLSIRHRLASIEHDAAFVDQVAVHYGLPVVANERCGVWYVRGVPAAPETKEPSEEEETPKDTVQEPHSAYFKSTDGHTGQWSFSTRRLNLHLLPLLARHGGLVLVDSTRRGKPMPDALSKTVPLWCAVLNQFFADTTERREKTDKDELFTPPIVPPSEHAQMVARIPGFVDALKRLQLDFFASSPSLSSTIAKRPLRPVWVTPDRPWPDIDALRSSYTIVVCCTASSAVAVDQNPDYVQGAADDTENWALGLTAELYWTHQKQLLDTAEADLPEVIQNLVALDQHSLRQTTDAAASSSSSSSSSSSTTTTVTPHLAVGTWTAPVESLPAAPNTCQVIFVPATTDASTWARSSARLVVGLGRQDKVVGRQLRYALPQIVSFVQTFLLKEGDSDSTKNAKQVQVFCTTGRDISVGAALAILCACFDANGQPIPASDTTSKATTLNKEAIRVRLGRIVTALPRANPSRTTLQSVHSYLMG